MVIGNLVLVYWQATQYKSFNKEKVILYSNMVAFMEKEMWIITREGSYTL